MWWLRYPNKSSDPSDPWLITAAVEAFPIRHACQTEYPLFDAAEEHALQGHHAEAGPLFDLVIQWGLALLHIIIMDESQDPPVVHGQSIQPCFMRQDFRQVF
jgi:hypothetical protein